MTHSVEQHKVPVVGKVEPGQLVGLVTESQDGLDGDVHNHHALGTEAKGQNLEGVGNEQTREAHVVKGGEEPDEDELGVAGARVGAVRVLVDGAADGPAHKGEAHAAGRDEEQGATAEAVDVHGGYDGDDEIVNGSTGAELLFSRDCQQNLFNTSNEAVGVRES
jgi:hypothetical protein